MGTRYGINFRGTIAGTTDGTYETYQRYGTNYPTTTNGITRGWAVTDTGSAQDDTSWASGNSPSLYGYYERANSAGYADFRVDLPAGAGTYKVWYIIPKKQYTYSRVRLYDGAGGGTLLDYFNQGSEYASATSANYYDNALSSFAYGSSLDYATLASVTVVATASYFTFRMSDNAVGSTTRVNHIAFEKQDTVIPVFQHYYAQRSR